MNLENFGQEKSALREEKYSIDIEEDGSAKVWLPGTAGNFLIFRKDGEGGVRATSTPIGLSKNIINRAAKQAQAALYHDQEKQQK